ncbi:hypothetical protein DFAR_1710002 [Desulfarculales bacterium]
MQDSRFPRIHLALPQSFPASLLRNRPGTPSGLPRPRAKQVKMPWTREGRRFILLFEQAVMTLVREMLVLAAARIIVVRRHATLAGGPILHDPGSVQNGSGWGQGRGSGRNRLQAGPQIRHHFHRPRLQAKADHLRYPRQEQVLPGPASPLPA